MSAARKSGYTFHGRIVREVDVFGQRCRIGREVGKALDYERDGKQFVENLTTDWASEIKEGEHWFRLKGADLRQTKENLRLGGKPPPSQAIKATPERTRCGVYRHLVIGMTAPLTVGKILIRVPSRGGVFAGPAPLCRDVPSTRRRRDVAPYFMLRAMPLRHAHGWIWPSSTQ